MRNVGSRAGAGNFTALTAGEEPMSDSFEVMALQNATVLTLVVAAATAVSPYVLLNFVPGAGA